MSFAILGLGVAVPSTIVDQADALRVAKSLCCRTPEHASWLPALYANIGINRRHLVLGADVARDVLHGTRTSQSPFLPTGQSDDRGPTTAERMRHYVAAAKPLALAATRRALDSAGLLPSAVTHLITVSCTGFHSPGVDCELIHGLGLPPGTQRTHVGYMGCHGALNGLRVARAFADAEPRACVLLCATELCSLHYHYGWDLQRLIANAIFADGAAAVVGTGQHPGGAAVESSSAWCLTASGSWVFPRSADAMTWTVGDHGFAMTLSKKVPGLIAGSLRPWLTGWLEQHGVALGQVASWAVHPGGPRIIEAVEEALGLPRENTAVSREVYSDYGNMSSPTVLFILERLGRLGALRPCVALGFGPGLTVEAALFR
jgi:predicted naringenin-chalcone synthase